LVITVGDHVAVAVVQLPPEHPHGFVHVML
jgi:hypothetical protein